MLLAVGLCALAFIVSALGARRSLVVGLSIMLVVGYVYGIVRANVPSPLTHLFFDCAAAGVYVTRLGPAIHALRRTNARALLPWVAALCAWPLLLFCIPLQDPAVQLVGLRGNIFLVPLLILGAVLTRDDAYRLALVCAGLNLVACAIAVAEFSLGLELFFPRNSVTEIIYASRDVATFSAYRIPSTFTSAHAYAGTMVMTVPLLVGAWARGHRRARYTILLSAAIAASLLAVFMAAARVHAVVLFLLAAVATGSARLRPLVRLTWIALLGCLVWIVAHEERLQRFMTLRDIGQVATRVESSARVSYLDLVNEYPFGTGLGGGGTSVPYFLRDRVRDPIFIENEYARLTLELGLPGLLLWVGFLLWAFSRRTQQGSDPWFIGRRLFWFACAAYFVTGFIGVGLLTSIPHTVLLFLGLGWTVGGRPHRAADADTGFVDKASVAKTLAPRYEPVA
jgi:hypothetical protein